MHRFAGLSALTSLACLLICLGLPALAAEARLLRYPDIHGERVAFVYAGDIWVAPTAGGRADRLTTDAGQELFPKFSPDGRHIAFSGEYGGNRQVFTIPIDGGTPRQLTFHNDVGPMPPRGGYDNQVLDWSPDGKHVLFRANRLPWGVRMGQPYVVPAEGGTERPLSVPESGGGMFSPDGGKLVYTPISREFRTWKRYTGGRAQNVWIYDLERDAAQQITDSAGTDNQPLWVGDTIYFTSDRQDGRLNLYAQSPAPGEARRVTEHRDFDVLWPSAGPAQVVYEAGGYLYRFDPAAERSERIRIELTGDFRQTLPRYQSVSGFVGSGDLSPSGKRAVFTARGDVFTVPAKDGEVRNLTRTPGIRELAARWSPDGHHVAYLSDRSGEYELYVRPGDGSGEERQLTRGGDVWRFSPVWSPDSSMLAFGDKQQRLQYALVESGKIVDVDHSDYNDITTYSWSPDNRWLLYTKGGPSGLGSIWVFNLEEREARQLTDGFTADFSPVFDPKGRYLYFLSNRDYNLTFSGYEFNYFYTRPTRLYAATLQADGPALMRPKSDEEEPQGGDEKAESGKGEQDGEDELRVEIDFDGFADRVVALPDSSANYGSVEANADGVFYVRTDQGGPPSVKFFSLKDEKVEVVLEGVGNYSLSADGKKLLYSTGDDYGIVDALPKQKSSDGRLSLDGMQMRVEPREEWKQIFHDAWLITRDWFYDPGMHGVDWKAIHDLYEPLVEHVAHRGDLDYILGEMGGELSAGHYYVNWGDMPGAERRNGGLLGAEIELDESGYFRIAEIFPGENWNPGFRSPLTETGVNVEEGDFILAVDGRSTRDVRNFYELLENAADRTVTLTVNGEPDTEGAREEQVRPVSTETNLRYLAWIESRRAMVDRLSGGRIGYIHMPNTAGAGNRELRRYFYPQSRKEALILDVRYNGGGFIPDRMLELLARTQLSFWARRGIEATRTPGFAHVGPKVCLINGYSSSGGDAFPYYFRKLGLGKLIGTRTWGGLIGLSGNPGFIDGGSVAVPRFRFMDTDGNWAVEGEGVAPDIEVVDRPELVARGEDPTLERAVQELLDELERNPQEPFREPAAPRIPR